MKNSPTRQIQSGFEHYPSITPRRSQFFRGVLGAIEVIAAEKHTKANILPLERTFLIGFLTVVPSLTRETGILKSRPMLQLLEDLIFLQLAQNEVQDLKTLPNHLLQPIQEHRKKMRLNFSNTLQALPVEKQAEAINIYARTSKEVEIIENFANIHSNNLGIEEVIRYRELANGISIVANLALVFGVKHFPELLEPAGENFNAISKKYSWLTENDHSNTVRHLAALATSFSMIGQLRDDWIDQSVDTTLQLTTIARTASKTLGETPARKLVEEKVKQYKRKTEDLGLSKWGTEGFDLAFRLWKGGMSLMSKNRMLYYLLSATHWRVEEAFDLYLNRERLAAQGKLTPQTST
ncbi:MAG: hypothetical protein WCP97_07820 [bacterium]